jgi:hypothetical protein
MKFVKINLQRITLFLFVIGTICTFGSCNTDSPESETDLAGTWTVTSWVEDGVAQPEVVESGVRIVFSSTTMTMSGSTFPFIYTGNYTIDEVDHIEAVLDETTGGSEINQYEYSVDATISSSNLSLSGNQTSHSPFWPDETKTILITAER